MDLGGEICTACARIAQVQFKEKDVITALGAVLYDFSLVLRKNLFM